MAGREEPGDLAGDLAADVRRHPQPIFGLNFDPSHMIWQQMDYLAPLHEFRDRIFHVHAKDARIDRAALEEHGVLSYPKLWHTPKIPGLGDVRWGAFFGALSDAGYTGHVAIEVEDRAFEGRSSPGSIRSSSAGGTCSSTSRGEPGASKCLRAGSATRGDDGTRRFRADGRCLAHLDLSVLIPVFNEVENVEPLHGELDAVLRPLSLRYELIFVDDGSGDGTVDRLERIQARDPEHVRVAFLWRNCGQTAALSAALDLARGEILVPMDGDRQNDPADIPRLLETLEKGYDVVSGWRRNRHDALLSRKIPSRIANRLVARISGVPLHDFGCTLKAYRRRVLAGVRLYGEMHRFIPIFAAWQGARVTEQVVNHRPRTAGKTKYGLGRTFNVVLDLILIRFLQKYAQRPIHFFGRFGLWSFALGFFCFLAMLYFKYVFPWPDLWWPADWSPRPSSRRRSPR